MMQERKVKALPNAMMKNIDTPIEDLENSPAPLESELKEETPDESKLLDVTPEESELKDETPDPSPEKETMPSDENEENCVMVDGIKVEIKPTKLKYFRNKAASAFGIIKAVPLHELLTYDKGVLDPTRDADQLLYDFLVAVFDDSSFVRDHYDEIDADCVDKICKIFGRLNHIDEKEEKARKNREAQAQAKR